MNYDLSKMSFSWEKPLNYKFLHLCVNCFLFVLLIIPFGLLCSFYSTQDSISPVAKVILVFCLFVLALQFSKTTYFLLKEFFPSLLKMNRKVDTTRMNNLVENEVTVQSTSLDHSESAISVSSCLQV